MSSLKEKVVDLKRFEALLDAYGAEPAQWPESERAAAERLLTQDSRAQALHTEALQLDQQLGLLPVPDISAALRARVLEIPIRHERRSVSRARFFGLRWAAIALVPCMIGFLSGTFITDGSEDGDDDAWNEVAALALPLASDALADDILDEDSP